jgi:hypothetical protein
VTGIRVKRDDANARKVTETLEIPPEVNVEHLKIARRADGLLIIEEDQDLSTKTSETLS